jgi:GNAT superfamily N-acetyltransferase
LTTNQVVIAPLGAADIIRHRDDLSALLIEAVRGGAEVSFLHPLAPERAAAFWGDVAATANAGARIVMGALDGDSLVGTVQAVPVESETAPRLASIAKLMVAQRMRGRGIGGMLLRAVEQAAAAAGRDILVLDTEEHSAAYRLYLRCGWILLGAIPDATLRADGTPCANAMFWKRVTA